jgi:tetratricopeptide (TPR) repeat protein
LTLAIWLGSGFVFAAVLNWTVSARSFLPLAPVVAILVVRRLTQRNPESPQPNTFLWPLTFSFALSSLVATADLSLANSVRTAARQLGAEYRSPAGSLWFEGNGGFQFYVHEFGATRVDYAQTVLSPGELLVLPSNNVNRILPNPDDVELVETRTYEIFPWLSTVNPMTGAGFYGASGLLPFVFGSVPTEKYFVLKVLRPLEFLPKTAKVGPHAKPVASIQYCNQALHLNPDQPAVLNDLAWILATSSDAQIRDGAKAVQFAERACALTHYQMTRYLGTLAAAYAEAGRFDNAITTAQKACDLATQRGETELLQRNTELLQLYRAHKPCREDP